jgi:hypothetical protein
MEGGGNFEFLSFGVWRLNRLLLFRDLVLRRNILSGGTTGGIGDIRSIVTHRGLIQIRSDGWVSGWHQTIRGSSHLDLQWPGLTVRVSKIHLPR